MNAFLRSLAAPVFFLTLAVLALHMAMAPLDPPYGVFEALTVGAL